MKSPSKRTVAVAVTGVVVTVGGLLTLLWVLVDSNSAQASTQLELARIALTILLGTGGLFGLYLAWRRQRSTEIALQQKERDQADVARAYALQERSVLATEADAEARRITDLYTKAIEQLGSDKAPVRLGGLYALERVAQDNPNQRQTIVNVLCAYLRMPYEPPDEPPPVDSVKEVVEEHRARLQEREIRLAVQHLLADHVWPGSVPKGPVETFWHDIRLDLAGAVLFNFSLRGCVVKRANFASAIFIGTADFAVTRFTTGLVNFRSARFTGPAIFRTVKFIDGVNFTGTTFAGDADFTATYFADAAYFSTATFNSEPPSEVRTYLSRAPADAWEGGR